MAVLLETANNEYLYRTATLPTFRSCTITGWARYKGSTYRELCGLNSGGSYLGIAHDDTVFKVLMTGTGDTTVRGSLPSVDDWVFFALTHKASSLRVTADVVVGAEEIALHSLDEDYWGGSAYDGLYLGLRNAAVPTNACWNGTIADVKVWSVPLSEAEIEAEQFTKVPVKTADLWAYYPLDVHTDLTDHGASYGAAGGRDLTASGTLSTEASDPPWAETSFTLSAAGGSFTWGVVAAALLRGFVLQAEATHPTGESYTLGLEPAAYTLTGEASESWVDYGIGADGDTLALTGGAAALGNVKRLISEAASYSLTGEASALSTTNILVATGATFTETGSAAGARVARFVAAAGDSYTWTGEDIDYFLDLSLIAGSAQYLLQGQNTEFIYSPDPVSPQERTFIWVG